MTRQMFPALLLSVLASGCATEQSALFALGDEAERIATLFWVMAIFLGLVFLAVVVFAVLAIRGRARTRRALSRETFVLGMGLVFPAVSLTGLLAYGLLVMSHRVEAGEKSGLRVEIVGEQWWWRVIYTAADGRRFESANELRIPVGVPVSLKLTTADVIHSFWVPNLAGKLDMIPGRTTTLTFTATKAGTSRGQCAEFCGGAHAFMSLYVVSLEKRAFDAWFEHEAADAVQSATHLGARLFREHGCGACHTIRGVTNIASIGPDLTHIGSRLSLAAAALPNGAEPLARWITDNQHIKPENKMPVFRIFTKDELLVLTDYLAGLR